MLVSNRGFSLVEMLVALVAGLLVAAAVTALYAAVIRANSTSVQLSMLNQDLQATLNIVARDIQRAGFKADAAQILARNTSGQPIDASGNVVTSLDRSAMFSAFTLDASAAMTTTPRDLQRLSVAAPLFDCVLLSYDANKDGAIAGNAEIMGYRYNQTQQEVEFHNWDTAAQQSCTATGWSALAGGESSTQITGLTFLLDPASGATDTGQRTLVLTITGQHKQNSQLQLELQRRVRLRNDQF